MSLIRLSTCDNLGLNVALQDQDLAEVRTDGWTAQTSRSGL